MSRSTARFSSTLTMFAGCFCVFGAGGWEVEQEKRWRGNCLRITPPVRFRAIKVGDPDDFML